MSKSYLQDSFKEFCKKNSFENNNLYIINALINDNVISSVCIALHGRTATYLVGFNLDKTNSANDLTSNFRYAPSRFSWNYVTHDDSGGFGFDFTDGG